MHMALSLGRSTLLDITQAKANLLRHGKNPGVLQNVSGQLPIHFAFLEFAFSNIGGLHLLSLWAIVDISAPGLGPKD